jgi:L-arabinokinase
LSDQELDPRDIADLAQAAEHRVVGAPCGLMDQLTVALGVDGALLPILCRPGHVLEPVRLPAGVSVVGWPSGHRRAVRAQPYTRARVAAFIGRALAEQALNTTVAHTSELELPDDSPVWDRVPETLTGDQALEWGIELADPLSAIEPGVVYQVRAGLAFAVREHQRTTAAHQALLQLDGARESQLRKVGRLMRASHDGYGTMGLGSPPTDRIVEVLDAVGPDGGVYGSRVSGGGSGGTVVVLATTAAIECLPELARKAGLPPPELARISRAR